ncbi:hypothetical protein EGT36_04395 [Agrobacterium sp. FDAARGOS_525]|nr:hypothetical protein EGT36_04395 [Agrobacterium sp. FDAARGOS_525]HCJ72641.1 hypothetical protein [Agrobacterium sp.]
MRSFDSNLRAGDSNVERNVSKLWANVSFFHISDSLLIERVGHRASGAINIDARSRATYLDAPAT